MRDQIRIIEPWHQGAAQQINTVVRDALPWLLDHADVIHQCGPDNVRACASTRRSCPHKARRAVTSPGTSAAELLDVLALADVVISRGGAGTIAELTALGKAAAFVPLATSAGNEQVDNAEHLAANGAAVTLVGDVTAERLWASVAPLLTDPQQRTAMAERARSSGRLVDVVLSAAGA
ncbi:glycosyltransferase [Streptomyces sp. NBC_01727]|uniref:UDP-N-acetylglucosamine--N-acetylmuramyl- (pentapeptide) pyrophosphoryl-undecaprenol N-acetylglucosamine transferase n=1 Tax=unclassified Streptomyces TaxID=2593676 RepID=UPI002E0DC02E|nr:hypothetical protein OIE76_01615 [Streptomyces sp. NBC_01727]